MTVRELFTIGLAIVLAGLAASFALERLATRNNMETATVERVSRVAKGVTYVGAGVAVLAMAIGLIIG